MKWRVGRTRAKVIYVFHRTWHRRSAAPLSSSGILGRGAKTCRSFARLKPRSRAILKKVLCGDNGIDARHLALDPLAEVFDQTPDALQARFARHAPALAAEAARRALKDADCRPEEIDAILISTCTGYLCPGLTSYVSEQLGLRPDVFALDLVGQGCGAALPNLRAAEAILAAGRAKKVLSVCVEVCSAAFYLDDDPGVLISACLFADGAGAAVLSNEPLPDRRRVEWKFAASRLVTAERDTLRFSHKNGMLRNILLPQVPQVAGEVAGKLIFRIARRGRRETRPNHRLDFAHRRTRCDSRAARQTCI